MSLRRIARVVAALACLAAWPAVAQAQSAIAGVARTLVIPAALAKAATFSKPTSCPILTVALLSDMASA